MVAKQESIGSTNLGLSKWVHVMFFMGTTIIGWLFFKVIETVWTACNLTFVWAPPPAVDDLVKALRDLRKIVRVLRLDDDLAAVRAISPAANLQSATEVAVQLQRLRWVREWHRQRERI